MKQIDVAHFNEVWAELKRLLKDGLLYSDFWDQATGFSLSAYENNSNAAGVALFNRLISELEEIVVDSGLPKFGRYFLLDLENALFVVINHGDGLLQGIALDPQRVNLGLLFNVALPKTIKKIEEVSN